MSAKDKQPTDPSDAPTPDGPEAEKLGADAAETKGEAPTKARYVFKIVPADPKNSFDFEDVADK